MKRVIVVPPLVPEYRKGLYDRLANQLADQNIEFTVVENSPAPRLAARADTISADWTLKVPCRWVRFMGRDVAIRDLSALKLREGDYIVVEQALKNLETYPLLARARSTGYKVAMWGHGSTYSTPQAAPLRSIKSRFTNKADWFFSYTERGARYVEGKGFPAERVTVLNNTIDTQALKIHLESVTIGEIQQARIDWELTNGRTALFLGGVDQAKGINFLLQSAKEIQRKLPGFTLLIGGTGSSLEQITNAQQSGLPVRWLGRLEGHQKALALKTADLMMIPEWIGLVAVDSLTAGTPIASTFHNSHSCEVECLQDNLNAVFSNHSITDYSDLVANTLTSPKQLTQLQTNALASAEGLSIENMTASFLSGLRRWSKGQFKSDENVKAGQSNS